MTSSATSVTPARFPDFPSPTDQARRRVLFFRDFTGYTGGHQKVADYFSHLDASPSFQPEIAFSSNSVLDESNPWYPFTVRQPVEYLPDKYECIFLAGMDWQAYLPFAERSDKPVVNLIQHVRHADPTADVHPFLTHRAIRICVSEEVATAIQATGKVNGPIFTIPNGHEMPILPEAGREFDVVIVGTKNPELARRLGTSLTSQGLRIRLFDRFAPRGAIFQAMNSSRIGLLLPNSTEGFYLPALEAMNYCELTIVPDCQGNRGFCLDGENCLMPDYTLPSLLQAVTDAQRIFIDPQAHSRMRSAAAATIERHSIAGERHQFLTIMMQLDQIWSARR